MDLGSLRPEDLPLALAELRHATAVGDTVSVTVDPTIEPNRLAAVFDAAALSIRSPLHLPRVTATAVVGLPDHVGPGMRMLCCGLNPSLHAADAGVGYVTGNNRFWPAMAAAGLTTADRDPVAMLRRDGIGMTDLVKRATPRADELKAAEYRDGARRLEQLCTWLRPGALVVVGYAGWRAGVDRRATAGWQPAPLGPTPIYVLPSTSGLNAGTSLADLVGHLRAAAAGPGTAPAT